MTKLPAGSLIFMKFVDRKGIVHEKPAGREVKKRDSCYGVAVRDGSVLLIKPVWIDRWELPGGGADPEESVFDAMKREFFEETGFVVKSSDSKPIVRKQRFYSDDQDIFYDSTMNFFRINKLEQSDGSQKLSWEIKKVKWVRIDFLDDKNTHKIHLEIIRGGNS